MLLILKAPCSQGLLLSVHADRMSSSPTSQYGNVSKCRLEECMEVGRVQQNVANVFMRRGFMSYPTFIREPSNMKQH